MVLTPAQRSLAYAKRDADGVASQLIKEKKFKELVDRIFETGDFDLFKAEVTEAQKRFAKKSGKIRKGTGIIPAQYIKQFNQAIAAGVDSPEFKNILRITGRSTEDILKLNELRPGGKVGVKIRSEAAAESFPESRKMTEEQKLESQKKAKATRATKAAVGTKYASEAELERFKVVNKQKERLNKFFKNKPNAINNTEFGREIKKLMDVRIDKDGNFFQKTRPDSYYVEKAKKGQIFDIFDINKIEKGQRITKQTINLNITPSQFNEGFIEGQVDRYFKKGGRLEGQTDKLKNIDEYLKSIGVKVDIGDVGRIGGGNKVFYESATGKFPHIYDTLKNLKIPDTLLTDINPTINIPGVTTASKIDRPEKALLTEDFKAFSSRLKNYDNLDPTTYPSKTYVRSELKKVPVEAPVNQAIKDFDIPKGTILKGLAKGTLRAVAPFVPFVGALGVALGVSDVAKAKDEGLEGEELGVAYFVGPELAKKYSDFKDRNLNVETESEGIMGLRNGGRVGFQGGGMDALQDDFSGEGKSKGRQDPMGGREDFTAAEIRAADPIGYGGGLTGPGFQDRNDQPPTDIPPPKKYGTIPVTVNLGSDSVLGFDVPKFVDFSLPTKYGLLNLRQRFSDFINPDEIDLNPELTFGGSVPLFGGDLRFGIGATKEGLMKDPSPFITFSKVLGGDKRR